MTKSLRSTLTIAVAIVAAGSPPGAAADDNAGRALAAGCRGCHDAAAKQIPALDGQPKETLVAKLRSFRDGTQAGTVMPQLAKGYTEAEVDAIAASFAASRASR
jgi:cytochrome c553